jgi:hypothetical protein
LVQEHNKGGPVVDLSDIAARVARERREYSSTPRTLVADGNSARAKTRPGRTDERISMSHRTSHEYASRRAGSHADISPVRRRNDSEEAHKEITTIETSPPRQRDTE